MQQYFFQFLIPVASAATIGAIFVAFYAFKTSKEHEVREKLRFEYSRGALLALGSNLDVLQNTVSDKLVPNVQAVYDHLLKGGVDIRTTGLVEIVHRAGFQQVDSLSPDNLFVFMGAQHDSLNISFLISFDQYSDLLVNSFAYYISHFPPDLMTDLLQINAANKIGAIGLRTDGDKNIVMIDHAMRVPLGKIEPDTVNQILLRLGATHSIVRNLLAKKQVERHELLINEFLKLKPTPARLVAQSLSSAVTEPAHAPY